MKKLAIIFTCVLLGVGILTGCGKKEEVETTTKAKVNDSKIVGTWTEDIFDSGYIFKADGTGEDTFWELKFTYTAYDGNLTVFYDSDTYGASTYSYSIKDDQLTMTRTDGQDNETFTYDKVVPEQIVTVEEPGVDVPAVEPIPEDGLQEEEIQVDEEEYLEEE